MAKELKIKVTFDSSKAGKDADKLGDQVAGIGDEAKKATPPVSRFGDVFNTALGVLAANAITRVANALQNLLAVGFREVIGGAVTFEEEMAGARKTIGLTRKETKELSQQVLNLSADLGIASSDLAKITEIAGQLGIRGSDNILKFTEVTAKLADVSDLTAEQAANALAKIQVAFNLTAESSDNLGSAINELSNTTAANARELVFATSLIGVAGAELGLSADKVLGFVSTLVDSGARAERAGTQLRNIFIKLSTEVDKLSSVIGITSAEFSTLVEQDALAALNLYLASLRKMPSTLQKIAIEDVFGLENFTAVATLASKTELLNKNLDVSANAFEEAKSLNNEFAISLDNSAKQFELLITRLRQIAIEVGTGALDDLQEALEFLNQQDFSSLTEGLQDALRSVINTIKAIIDLREELLIVGKALLTATVAIKSWTFFLTVSKAVIAAYGAEVGIVTKAKLLFSIATTTATTRLKIFFATLRANPFVLLATVITAAVTALILFKDNTDKAIEATEKQNKSLRDLEKQLKRVSGTELVNTLSAVKDEFQDVSDEVIELKKELADLQSQLAARQVVTFDDVIAKDLKQRIKAVNEQLMVAQINLGSLGKQVNLINEQGAKSTEFLIAIRQKELNQINDIAAALTSEQKARKLILEDEIAGLQAVAEERKKAGKEEIDPEQLEKQIITQQKLRLLELQGEIELLEDGGEKILKTIEFNFQSEILKRRELFNTKFPDLFKELEEKLVSEQIKAEEAAQKRIEEERKLRDIAEPFPFIAQKLPEISQELQLKGVEKGEEQIESLNLALEALSGNSDLVGSALNQLRNELETTISDEAKQRIEGLIAQLEELKRKLQFKETIKREVQGALVDAFVVAGDAIAVVLAGVESGIISVSDSLTLLLAELATNLGKILLAEALAIALVSPGRALRLAGAGAALIALGAGIRAATEKGIEKRREEERRQEEEKRNRSAPPRRQRGGRVARNRAVQVNEKEQEFFLPDQNGTVLPNIAAAKAALNLDNDVRLAVSSPPQVITHNINITLESQTITRGDQLINVINQSIRTQKKTGNKKPLDI